MACSDEPHVIRLRGPWQFTRRCVEKSDIRECSVAATGDVRLPVRSGNFVYSDFRGRVELRRNFNWPEPLSYRESLWIVVQEAAWPRLSVDLNGQPLGTVEGFRHLPAAWEITPRVTAHNELQLTWNIDAPATLEKLSWVEVQLEVRLDVGPQD